MDTPPKVRVLDTAQSFDTDLVIFRFLAITKIGVILLFLGTRGFRGLSWLSDEVIENVNYDADLGCQI